MLPDIVHVSSAHPWVDNRVHLREAAAAADAGYRVRLIAVESDLGAPPTAVEVVRIPRRARVRRMVVSTTQALTLALRSRARVVHLHDPELIWTIPVLRLAGRTVVYDAHEDLPDQVWGKDYLTHRQRAVFASLSHGLLRVAGTANRVVTATEWTGRRFPAPRRIAIHNFPFARAEDDAQVGLEARPALVAHVGVLSHDRGIDVLASVVEEPSFPAGWRVEMVGSIDRATSTERCVPPRPPAGLCTAASSVPWRRVTCSSAPGSAWSPSVGRPSPTRSSRRSCSSTSRPGSPSSPPTSPCGGTCCAGSSA